MKASAIARRAIAKLDKTYTLYYVSRGDDGLSSQQLADIFDGDWQKVEETLDEYADEGRWHYVREIIKELLTDEEYQILDDSEYYDEVRFAIEERDDSEGALLSQLSVTGNKLMRYDLDFDLESSLTMDEADFAYAVRTICEKCGIDYLTNKAAIESMVIECSYGGQLYVLFYDDPEPIVRGVLNKAWGNDDVPTTITWENPSLVILDGMNGSGMDTQVKGTITRPFDPDKFRMDGTGVKGHGYTWDDVAGVVKSAYSCNVTLSKEAN